MYILPNEYYHIYNRGNNNQPIFFNHDNYLFFIQKIRNQLLPVADIIAYCLMPNHFHFIIHANENSIKERKKIIWRKAHAGVYLPAGGFIKQLRLGYQQTK